MEPLRKELAEGVFLTYVPAAKFKTGVLGAQLITPLEGEHRSPPARCCRRAAPRHDRAPRYALDRRGAGPPLRGVHRLHRAQEGREQCLGFVGSFLDERYVPGGERLLEPMADLLGELLLDPAHAERALPERLCGE